VVLLLPPTHLAPPPADLADVSAVFKPVKPGACSRRARVWRRAAAAPAGPPARTCRRNSARCIRCASCWRTTPRRTCGWGSCSSAAGYEAELAANGLEVLAALERREFDVIFLDVQMPEMDGIAAARAICRRGPPGRRPAWWR